VPAPGELLLAAVVGLLAILIAIRIGLSVSRWIRRTRRPEARAIRVVGVGGGGSNAIDRMVAARIRGVDFVALNTDAQALRRSRAGTRLRIGNAVTGGLGSGGDPEVGRRAAIEDEEWIGRLVAGADLVFVTAGFGGGTGSGAAPVVAAAARKQGALTVAVVTKPFGFEGTQRIRIAERAVTDVADNVDALIVVPNDRVGEVLPDDASLQAAFEAVDDVLLHAVRGIIELITAPGIINLDFADIRSVMADAGPALIGLGYGSGADRATEAARQAIDSPLLEANIDGARGILFNVAGPADLRLSEVRTAADEIRRRADPDANIIFGTSVRRSPGDDVLITLIATGLAGHVARRPAAPEVSETVEPSKEPATASIEPAAASIEPAAASEQKRPPRRPVRPIRPRSSVDAPAPATMANETSAGESSDDDDLDVPSFLRHRRPSTDRA
jgi:cell division protein FtsZ